MAVAAPVASAHVPPAGNWSLRFDDEFNGSSLDTMKWNYNYPWSQHGLADDSVEQASQVTVAGGAMNLTAIASGQWYNNNWYDYTSGAVNTSGKLNFTYGYIEASQKMPSQQGTWPAFWMLQNGWPPEIDIEEVPAFGSNPSSYSSGYHYSNSSGVASSAGPGIVNEGTNLSGAYHTYGVNWQPTSLTFYFDGNVVGSISGSQANIAQSAQQYLLLDLGVGGWPGNPPAGTAFPAVMSTDWVRVWQQLPGGAATNQSNWTKAANGSWDDSTAWSGTLPTVSANTEWFGTLTGSPAAVTVDWSGSRSTGGITIQSNTSYTLGATANGGAGLMLAPADGVPLTAETVSITGNAGSGQSAPVVNARIEVPFALETLAVSNGYTAPITFNGDMIGPGNLSFTAGKLTLNGNDQLTGTHTVSGGAAVTVGGKVSASGTFTVNSGSVQLNAGSTLTVNSWTSIGGATGGTGTLVNNGGAITANGDFNVGDVTGSAGAVTMTAGSLAAANLYVGKSGSATGVVAQSGGAVTTTAGATTDWRIGGATTADAAAVGTYNLSGGSFTSTNNLQVGGYGTGVFRQTGGVATVNNWLSIGRFAGAHGTYDMSGGTGSLTSTVEPDIIVGEQGTGTLLVGGSSVVTGKGISLGHNGGTGTVTQTGGAVIVATNGVLLGSAAGGTGSYTLSGGLLITPGVTRGAGNGYFTFNGGTLDATADNAAFMQGLTSASINSGGGTINTAGHSDTIAQPLSGTGGLTKAGNGTLTVAGANTFAGTFNVSAGIVSVATTGSAAGGFSVGNSATLSFAAQSASASAVLVRTNGPLALSTGSTATIAAAPTSAARELLSVGGLTIAPGAKLDLSNNDLDVRGGSLSDLTAQAAQGFAGGAWNGPSGLISATAAVDAAHLSAVGVIQNVADNGTTPLYTSFDGKPVAATDVLARYIYYGDTNLDGSITAADYTRIDAGYLLALTGWANGDFNYDGTVDGSDYSLVDNAFNQQASPPMAVLSSSLLAAPAAAVAAVPEPSLVALISVVTGAAVGRRRRR